jgi:F420-nonreducing hydrogenase I cytochrome b subunit
MIMVPALLAANWILIPYNIFSASAGGVQEKLAHFMDRYISGPDDAKRMKAIILNFFGKSEWQTFTIFDEVSNTIKPDSIPL